MNSVVSTQQSSLLLNMISNTFDNYAAELQVPFEKSAASVIILNSDVSKNFENNYDNAPIDTAESQVPVEKMSLVSRVSIDSILTRGDVWSRCDLTTT